MPTLVKTADDDGSNASLLSNKHRGGLAQEKLYELHRLLTSIREKTLALSSQTDFFRRLNYKLEALIVSFDGYSEKVAANEATKNNVKGLDGDIDGAKCKQLEKRLRQQDEQLALSQLDPRKTISSLFVEQRRNRKIAMEIYQHLETNITTSLDDIVRHIKQSKYRVINVLNILVKEI